MHVKKHRRYSLLSYMAVTTVFLLSLTGVWAQENTAWEKIAPDGWTKSFQRVVYAGVGERFVAGTTSPTFLNGGDLWLTTDGGENWSMQETHVANIRGIEFCSAEDDLWLETQGDTTRRQITGYAVGGAEGVGLAMYIGKTSDGGATWTDLSQEFRDTLDVRSTPLYGLAVIDYDTVYVSSKNQVFKTTNGGASWLQAGDIAAIAPRPTADVRTYLHGNLHFTNTVDGAPAQAGFVSSADALFVTRDGGNRWQRLEVPWDHEERTIRLQKLRFFNDRDGLALLTGEYDPGFNGTVLLRTQNGGADWSVVARWSRGNEPVPSTFASLDGVHLWAGGVREHIWRSTNGGADWQLVHESTNLPTVWGFTLPGPGTVALAWLNSASRGISIRSYLKRVSAVGETPTTATETVEEPPAAAQDEQKPRAVVSDMVTALGYRDGQPLGVRSTFAPQHNPIRIWMRLNDPPVGSVIAATWFYRGVEPELEIGRVDAQITPETDHFEASFELREGQEWPEGAYRVDITLDGRHVGTLSFTVSEDG